MLIYDKSAVKMKKILIAISDPSYESEWDALAEKLMETSDPFDYECLTSCSKIVEKIDSEHLDGLILNSLRFDPGSQVTPEEFFKKAKKRWAIPCAAGYYLLDYAHKKGIPTMIQSTSDQDFMTIYHCECLTSDDKLVKGNRETTLKEQIRAFHEFFGI
jgi:hypothetical protein